ncbi:MAG: hypothetical protein ACRYGC_14425 [Janthinobacterium lividum]
MRVTFRCDLALESVLPRPAPARDALPGWLRDMPRHAASELHAGAEVRTVKHCPPFVDAMAHGFTMPLACDVAVADGRLSWDWAVPPLSASAHPRAPISFHGPAQLAGTPFHDPQSVAVKFNAFWTIELEPGWSLLAMHPLNRPDLPFRLLSGLVDCDRFSDVGVLFPAVWVDPGFRGTLPRGTPFAQCVPVPREPMELDIRCLTDADARRYDATAAALLGGVPHHYRRLRAPRGASEGGRDSPNQGGAEGGGIEEQAPARR